MRSDSIPVGDSDLTVAAASARRQRDVLPHRIATRRLVLRAPIRGDVPDLVRLADDRSVARMLPRLPSPYTRADAIAFVEIFAQRADERPYAITLKDRLVGIVGLSFFADGQSPELGYWLGEPHRGQGLMAEAVRGLLDTAFATRLYPRFQARAFAHNLRSLRVLERAGFVEVGRRSAPDAGEAGADLVLMQLEQPRWM